MARVVYAANALTNLERIFEFLTTDAPGTAAGAVDAIQSAVETLEHHPLIGRPTSGGLRELVISFGHTGYLALYRFRAARDEVRVLAIRHQRELGYEP